MKLEPVTLTGRHVRLEPLTLEHAPALWELAQDPELWRWTWNRISSPGDLRAYLQTALNWQAEGTALPFATIDAATGTPIGSTRFANADLANRRLEIGWTWVGRPWQRTPVNTEAKYLMLRHAFETLGCMRVELKTDSLNQKSRNAMLRIGAKEEGTFRKHGITDDGRIRHTVWYSIVDDEWPAVKQGLEEMLARPWTPR